jgi:AGCS family alanine or glycine:cation symporter
MASTNSSIISRPHYLLVINSGGKMDSVLQYLNNGLDFYNTYIGIYILMFCLLPTGIYLTVRSRFVQLFKLRHAFDIVSGKFDCHEAEGDISHFQALCAALSATVGTGNIAGVALAIAIGGPGAIVWMWVTGFIGMASKFAECTLAQKYRVIHDDGTTSGGPMYYIQEGLKDKLGTRGARALAVIFAVATIICSFGTGNMAQSNSIVSGLGQAIGNATDLMVENEVSIVHHAATAIDMSKDVPLTTIIRTPHPYLTYSLALFTAFLVGLVIVGGIKRIGSVAEMLVPFMAVFYFIAAVSVILASVNRVVAVIIVTGIVASIIVPRRLTTGRGKSVAAITLTWMLISLGLSYLKQGALYTSIKLILVSAFSGHAAAGGFLGATFIMAMRQGLARGLFSNEAGQGSAPIAHAAARTSEPIREGFVAMIEPLVDTLCICSLTALVIIFTGVWSSGERGVALTASAFKTGLAMIHPSLGEFGFLLVTIGLFLFAISTAISWSYYGGRAVMFLIGEKAIMPYNIVYCVFVFLGGVFSIDLVWKICDAVITLMAFPNLIAIMLLSPVLFKILDEYVEPPQPGTT